MALGLVLAAASGTGADQDPNLARGFSPGDLYDYSGIDSINLLNGGLNVNLPIGPRYPVGDGLSYGLHLSYSSNTWEPEIIDHPVLGPVARMHPRRRVNSGHGWNLSLGGMLFWRGSDLSPFSTGFNWESPDGSEHLFYPSAHHGEPLVGCEFTRDNTYLRLCVTAPRVTQPPDPIEVLDRYTLELPDGTIHTYEETLSTHRLSPWDDDLYRLVEIEDRFGNSMTVSYQRFGSSMTWTIQDSVNRTHTVHLTSQTVDGAARWRVNLASLSRFGGGAATYQFLYNVTSIDRSCKDEDPATGLVISNVPLLTDVVLPAEAGSYRMPQYNTECTLGQAEADLPGTLARLDLPTEGQLHWTYEDYLFRVPEPQLPSDPTPQLIERSTGVIAKKGLDASGTCASGPMAACTWTYGPGDFGEERRTAVTNPVGDRTVHFFRQQRPHEELPLYVGWDYGLPFSTAQPTNAGMYLSRQIYKGSSTLVREVYVLYEHDRLIATRLGQDDWTNSNRRTIAERMLYHDDKLSGVPRFSETRRDDFDGYGHYRETERSGNLRGSSTTSQATTTDYNPDRGTYQIDQTSNLPSPNHDHSPWSVTEPWVLPTYASMRAEEPGTAVASQYCFDSGTGRLTRQRLQASATGPGGTDVIVVHQRFPQSAIDVRYIELVFGGDEQAVGTGNLCDLALPSTPVYRTRHKNLYGVRAKTEPLVPTGGGVTLGFATLDLAIDPNTGLPSSSTDAAGLTTNYLYDALGRLTHIQPVAGGDAWTKILYVTATPIQFAKVWVTRYPNGSTAGTPLEQSRYVYDRFGRLKRDERQIPGHGWTAVETGYNALGWKTFVSERGAWPGSLPHRTWFSLHDAFGRPTKIQLPDHPSDDRHWVKLTYAGDRVVRREVSIASDLVGGETRSETTEKYDHLGRLWQVQEPSGPGGVIVNTNYGYDAAGRLFWVRQADIDGFVQARDFFYDGRGFLLSERHPENGWTVYSDYDAGGNAGRKRVGPVNGPFDLGFTFDAAGRLTHVRESGTGRLLKAFTYGTGATASDRSNNKIKTAVRHNWVLHPTNGNQLDIIVTETYTFGGTGGRPSLRTTQINAGHGFSQGWAYDDLGQVATVVYPTCTHATSECGTPGFQRPRAVHFIHQLGYLTSITGWASPITYHHNGMLDQIHNANGVVYQQGLDDHWMRRPGSLGVTHPLHSLGLAEGTVDVPLFYTYDGAGNVKSWYDEEWRYDMVSRVLEGRFGGGESQAYTYDVFGNIKTITTNRGTPQTVQLGVDRTTNRLSASTYDDAGNLTGRGLYTYGYDALSMMRTTAGGGSENTYIYTADDERIWTVDSGGTGLWRETLTLRDLDGKVLRAFTTASGFSDLAWNRDYVHRDGQLLATARVDGPGETRHHFHLNHLGTPLLITRGDGSHEALHGYFPFGEELNPNNDTEPMKYTGHERDFNQPGQTDDLDYMHARYYVPLMGRFQSVDPAKNRSALKSPQFFNRYTYTANNPLKYVDPDGECAVPAGLKEGQVGICIESFIASHRVGGIAFGDNRSFEPNNLDATYRTSLRMTIDPQEGRVVSSADDAGFSEVGLSTPLLRPKGTTTVQGGILPTGDGGHHISLYITGDNGFGAKSLGTIEILANLTIDAQGNVGLVSPSMTKGFPSIEGYAYRIVDGQLVVQVLFQKLEEDLDLLKGPMDRVLTPSP